MVPLLIMLVAFILLLQFYQFIYEQKFVLSFVDMTCFRPIVNNDIIQRLNEIPMISQKFREIQLVTKFMK